MFHISLTRYQIEILNNNPAESFGVQTGDSGRTGRFRKKIDTINNKAPLKEVVLRGKSTCSEKRNRLCLQYEINYFIALVIAAVPVRTIS